MTPLEYKFLKPAKLSLQSGQPFSEQYQDIYFNSDNGLEETRYVFIQGNDLFNRWHAKQQTAGFCIAETGFGSGLNFLCTCQAWQACDKKPAHLHFISTELHPMSADDMRQVHQLFPELEKFSQVLLKQYGSSRAGMHRFRVSKDITLTLILGEATAMLKQLQVEVDAWFLDGFSPKSNPELWSADLFSQMASLSKAGTTAATFTAASMVRKGLVEAGFEVQKRPGFGRKREMTTACFRTQTLPKPNKQPWHPLPKSQSLQNKVTIIGGGIAGMCLAKSFHQSGYHTTVIDYYAKPMQQASGNGYAMMMPLLTATQSPEALFYLRAFEYARHFYDDSLFHAVGVKEFLHTAKELNRAESLAELDFPKQLITFQNGQLSYPQSGYLDAYSLAEKWRKHINEWLTAEVFKIKRSGSYWQIFDSDHQLIHQCETLIVASGLNSDVLIENQNIPLTAKLGQTHQLETTNLQLRQLQLQDGYIIPINEPCGHYLIGATFDHHPTTNCLHDDFSQINHLSRNLQHWQSNDFFQGLNQAKLLSSHTAIRATTPDHLPICGPVIDEQQFNNDYQDLHHGKHWQQYPEATIAENLYVLTGLGSRGFTSAPLLAEYLMSMITGQPLPLEADLCKIIHPNRFNYRRLKKPQ